PVGRRRDRVGLESARRGRGVVGQGAAAARGGRMTVLSVAVAGRGLVEPDAPVFYAGDDALLRGRAAFETTRVYGGRPFMLDAHVTRLGASAASLGLPPPDRVACLGLAATVVGAAGESELGLRLYWTGETLVATAAAIPLE